MAPGLWGYNPLQQRRKGQSGLDWRSCHVSEFGGHETESSGKNRARHNLQASTSVMHFC